MKKIHFGVLVLTLACGAMVLTGCKKDMDDYVKKAYSVTDEDRLLHAQKVLGVIIDRQHDWSMGQQFSIKVTADAALENIQQLTILDGNPYEDVTYLLTNKAVNKGETVTLSFLAPTVADVFYVACINKDGECVARPFIPGEDTYVSFTEADEKVETAASRRAAEFENDFIVTPEYTNYILRDFYSFRNAVLKVLPEGKDNHKTIGDEDFRNMVEIIQNPYSTYDLSLHFIYGDGSDNDNIWYTWYPEGQAVGEKRYLIKDRYKDKPVPYKDLSPRKSMLTGHYLYCRRGDKNDKQFTPGDILDFKLADNETPMLDTSSHPRVKLFMFNGYVFVACEDGNDWDYNDRLYWIPNGQDRIEKAKSIPVKPEPSVPQLWTYAWEDNTMEGNDVCDYDMNDCVIEVQEKDGDPSKLEISLVALGATRDLWLGFENKNGKSYNDYKPVFGNKELHEALGVPSGVMANTGNGTRTVDSVKVIVDKPAGFDFQTCSFVLGAKVKPEMQGIYENDYYMLHVATAGTDPHGIVVPGKWNWPTERTCIKDAYLKFNTWVSDRTQAKGWYMWPTEGKVVKR